MAMAAATMMASAGVMPGAGVVASAGVMPGAGVVASAGVMATAGVLATAMTDLCSDCNRGSDEAIGSHGMADAST
jgi:hypothetical protein